MLPIKYRVQTHSHSCLFFFLLLLAVFVFCTNMGICKLNTLAKKSSIYWQLRT